MISVPMKRLRMEPLRRSPSCPSLSSGPGPLVGPMQQILSPQNGDSHQAIGMMDNQLNVRQGKLDRNAIAKGELIGDLQTALSDIRQQQNQLSEDANFWLI